MLGGLGFGGEKNLARKDSGAILITFTPPGEEPRTACIQEVGTSFVFCSGELSPQTTALDTPSNAAETSTISPPVPVTGTIETPTSTSEGVMGNTSPVWPCGSNPPLPDPTADTFRTTTTSIQIPSPTETRDFSIPSGSVIVVIPSTFFPPTTSFTPSAKVEDLTTTVYVCDTTTKTAPLPSATSEAEGPQTEPVLPPLLPTSSPFFTASFRTLSSSIPGLSPFPPLPTPENQITPLLTSPLPISTSVPGQDNPGGSYFGPESHGPNRPGSGIDIVPVT
ncbi:hypothetical protein VTO42DRAFT_6986 [Malbranchea cinnamomea]